MKYQFMTTITYFYLNFNILLYNIIEMKGLIFLGLSLSMINAFKINTEIMVADPQQCIQQKCPNQWAACKKDPKCQPTLQDCEKKCGSDTGCWKKCLISKGDKAATDVAKCAAANHCLGEQQQIIQPTSTQLMVADPQECVESKCPNQWDACQKDQKCIKSLEECDKQCSDSTSCWERCLQKKGNKTSIELWKCAVANRCLDEQQKQQIKQSTQLMVADPQQCIEQKCPKQWEECKKDPKCQPTLQDCEKKCGSDTGCWKKCLYSKGDKTADSVAKCAAANHCLGQNYFESAMKETCVLQHANCMNKWSCRATLRKCLIPDNLWSFDIDCLSTASLKDQVVADWYHCVGENKLI